MANEDLLNKLLGLLVQEVMIRMPKAEAMSNEELYKNMDTLLQEAEWFKTMVKDRATEAVDNLGGYEECAANAAEQWIRQNFSISDYKTEIEEIADQTMDNFDLSGKVEEAIDNYDFSRAVESAIDDYDFSDVVEDLIDNHDFSDAIETALKDAKIEPKVQEMVSVYIASMENRIVAMEELIERVQKALKKEGE